MKIKNILLYALAAFIFATPQALYCPTAAEYLQQAFNDFSGMSGESFEGSPFAMGFCCATTPDEENPFPEISEIEKLYNERIVSGEKPELFEFIDGFLHGHSMLFKNDKGALLQHKLTVNADNALAQCSVSYANGQARHASDPTGETITEAEKGHFVDLKTSTPSSLVIKMHPVSFLAGFSRAYNTANPTNISTRHHIRRNQAAAEITAFLEALTAPAASIKIRQEIAKLKQQLAKLKQQLAKLTKQLLTPTGKKRGKVSKEIQTILAQQQKLKDLQKHLKKSLADLTRLKPAPARTRTDSQQAAIEADIARAHTSFTADEAHEKEITARVRELKFMRAEEARQREIVHLKKLRETAELERLHHERIAAEAAREKKELRRMRHQEHVQRGHEKQLRRRARYQTAMSKAGLSAELSGDLPSFEPLPEPISDTPASAVATQTLSAEVIAILAQAPDDEKDASSPSQMASDEASDEENDEDVSVAASSTSTSDSSGAGEPTDAPQTIRREPIPGVDFVLPPPLLPSPGPYLDGFLHGRNTILYSDAGTREYFINNMLFHAHDMIQRINAHIATEFSTTGLCAIVHKANLDHWIGIYNGVCEGRRLLAIYYKKGFHAGRYNDAARKTNITTEIARIAPVLNLDHLSPRLNLVHQFNAGFTHGQASVAEA